MGKSERTIEGWEQEGGHGPGTQQDLVAMCRLYGITADWYLENQEPIHRERAVLPDYITEHLDAIVELDPEDVRAITRLIARGVFGKRKK